MLLFEKVILTERFDDKPCKKSEAKKYTFWNLDWSNDFEPTDDNLPLSVKDDEQVNKTSL